MSGEPVVHVAVEQQLRDACSRVEGLHSVCIHTVEGVELANISTGKFNNYSTTFAFLADQISTIGLGSLKTVTAKREDCVFVYTSLSKELILSLVGDESLDLGLTRKLIPAMQELLEPVCEGASQVAL